MRIVFAGTPDFAVPQSACRACARRSGRGLHAAGSARRARARADASPVKLEAIQRGIPVLQPETLKRRSRSDALRAMEPDLLVVVAYGLILPPTMLEIPRFGCWNVHASLLPRWRGAAPIQRAIEAGDARNRRLPDADGSGPGYRPGAAVADATPSATEETGGQLHDRLAELGAQTSWPTGWPAARGHAAGAAGPQPEAGVTYAHKIDKARSATGLVRSRPRRSRARCAPSNPWPMAEGDGRRRAPAHPTARWRCDWPMRARRARCWPPAARARHRLRRRRAAHCACCSAKAARRSPPPITQRAPRLDDAVSVASP